MKKLWLFVVVIIVIISGSGCKDDPIVTPSVAYPIEIPFEEYSLEGTSCKLENIEYTPSKPNSNEIIIINSNEELGNYIECTEAGGYPEVDFSKSTLLLARGATASGFREIVRKRLSQLSTNEYQLDIEISLYDIAISEFWVTALVVTKLNKESNINLTVNIYEG